MDNVISIIKSYNAIPIRLTHKQWSHIIENHDCMAGCLDLVLETLSEPDLIIQG